MRSLKGHSARVASLAWNGSQLSSGSKDTTIMNHDVRIREHVTAVLKGHEQEVCGLAWSPSGQQLASGGNDNLLYVWDGARMSAPPAGPSGASHQPQHLHRIDAHQAAVKALAWCPFQGNLLASGGGTADRCIKFWNTHTGAMLNSVDTGSQVCALQWSKHERELLSSHGYSQNQLCLWKYPTMAKMAELKGHTARVLHMAQSPDGTTVVSAAADETLRFWKVFAVREGKGGEKGAYGADALVKWLITPLICFPPVAGARGGRQEAFAGHQRHDAVGQHPVRPLTPPPLFSRRWTRARQVSGGTGACERD